MRPKKAPCVCFRKFSARYHNVKFVRVGQKMGRVLVLWYSSCDFVVFVTLYFFVSFKFESGPPRQFTVLRDPLPAYRALFLFCPLNLERPFNVRKFGVTVTHKEVMAGRVRICGSLLRWRECCSSALSPAAPLRNPSADPRGGAAEHRRRSARLRGRFGVFRALPPVSGAAHSSGGLTSWRPGRNESASHRLGWIECKICSAFRAERPPGSASRNFSDARVRAQPVGLSPGKLLLPWRLRSVPCFGIAFVGGAGSRGGVCVRAAAPRSGSTVLTCAYGVALLRSTVRDVWKSLQLQPGNLRLLRGLPAHVRLDLRRSRLHAW